MLFQAQINGLSYPVVDCPCFPPRSIFTPWLVLHHRTTRVQERRNHQNQQSRDIYKPLLVQCALNAIRAKNNLEVQNRYLSSRRRRGHKKQKTPPIYETNGFKLSYSYSVVSAPLPQMIPTTSPCELYVNTLVPVSKRNNIFCPFWLFFLPPLNIFAFYIDFTISKN